LVTSTTIKLKDVYLDFPIKDLAKGVYLLSVKVGNNEPFTRKIYGGGL
jgi:hypothetical protein